MLQDGVVNMERKKQKRVGARIGDFVEAIDKPGFNMTNYLGADVIEAATWYGSPMAA